MPNLFEHCQGAVGVAFTPRGNTGDIGRTKRRKRRRWFSRKYYASVMRLKEFYEENIGEVFAGIMSDFARRANKK